MNPKTSSGLILALLSAAAFGISGALAKSLLVAGWSPAAAVTWRLVIGALALLIPGILALGGRWRLLTGGWSRIVLFGLLAVAGCQLAYFLAVERLPVAIALLLEYCAVILVVLWLWLRKGFRPRPLTIVGAGVALFGLILVLNVFGVVRVDIVGVAWALLAATGLAAFFVISADGTVGLPPLVLASGGLLVGAVTLLLAGAVGIVPMTWSRADVSMAGLSVPWWLMVMVLGLYAAAFAYASGIMANRRLGSKVASFVGLSEVMFAVLWAWLLLSEMPTALQLLGGAAILAGVVLIKVDEEGVAPRSLRPTKPGAPVISPVSLPLPRRRTR